jgi:hypothetical protein
MPLTPKDAFTLGFMYRCAEEGLVGEKLASRMDYIEKRGNDLLNIASGMGKNLLSLPILGSIAAGGLAGHVVGSTIEPEVSEEDLKAKELISTYKAYAARAKARRKARTYRPAPL